MEIPDQISGKLDNTGLLIFSETAAKQRNQGERVNYSETYIRTTPRFETGDKKYDWLNRVIAVANGSLDPAGPTYQVFAIQ